MCDILSDIHALGAELLVVGNGQPWQAKAFRQERGLTFPLLVDPDMHAYRLAGLKRGVKTVFNLRGLKHTIRALRAGLRITSSVQGDPWQQGGTFVILPDGNMPLAHRSEEGGDHVAPADVLHSLQTAIGDRPASP